MFKVFCSVPGMAPGEINGLEFVRDKVPKDKPPRLVAVDVPQEAADYLSTVPGYAVEPMQQGSKA